MPRSITIPDVDDATATWLVAEAGRRGMSVELVAGVLLRRGGGVGAPPGSIGVEPLFVGRVVDTVSLAHQLRSGRIAGTPRASIGAHHALRDASAGHPLWRRGLRYRLAAIPRARGDRWHLLRHRACPLPEHHRHDGVSQTGTAADACWPSPHQGASISFASGWPAANAAMLVRVVSRIVPRASRVKNA